MIVVRAVAASAAACTAVTLAACGAPARTPAPDRSATAQVDAVSGTIRLPLDQYSLTRNEQAVVETANDLAMSRCMQAAGQGRFFPFVDHRDPDVVSDRRFGVWIRAEVSKWGYGEPPPSEREKTLRRLNKIEFTPEADATYNACIEDVRKQGLAYSVTNGVEAAEVTGVGDPMKDPEAQAVMTQWRDCLQAHGVAPPASGDNQFVPRNADRLPLQEQIKVGLVDVDCHAQLSMTKRLADIAARYQQPYVTANEAVLVARLTDARKVLATARDYLAKSPAGTS